MVRTRYSLYLSCAVLLLASMYAQAQTWTIKNLGSSAVGITNPAVGENANGLVAAAWIDGTQLKASLRIAGTWGAPAVLAATGTNALPSVAVGSNGDIVVAWLQTTTTARVMSAFYTASAWQTPVALSGSSTTSYTPVAAYDSYGRATVAWMESTGVACNVYSVTGTAAAGFTAPYSIAAACYNYLNLAVNPTGEAVLGMSTPNFRGSIVSTANRGANGVWGPEVVVSPRAYRQSYPAVGIANNGASVVTFADSFNVYYATRPRGGAWSGTGTVALDNFAGDIRLAVDGLGDAVVVYRVWYMDPVYGVTYPLMASRMKAGSNLWSAPAMITASSSNIGSFSVSGTPKGSVVAAWSDGNNYVDGVSSLSAGATAWVKKPLAGYSAEVAATGAAGKAAVLWNPTGPPSKISVATAPLP